MSHTEAFFHARRRRRKRVALIVALCVGCATVLFGLIVLALGDGLTRAQNVRQALTEAQVSLVARDMDGARAAMVEASAQVDRIEQRVQFVQWLKPVPYVGRQVEALRILVEDGRGSLAVISSLLNIAIDIESDLQAVGLVEGLADIDGWASLDPEIRRELVLSLHRNVPELEAAHARLSRQRVDLERLDGGSLFFGLRIVRDELLSQVRLLDDSLNIVIPVLSVLPEMGGFLQPQHYLLFLQNNGELRPTGGFWGTYGVLRVENGEIVDVVTDDIYAVDFPSEGVMDEPTPAPIAQYLGLDTWYLRDANWSPDVPTAARRALDMYRQETQLPDQQYVTAPRVEFQGVAMVTPALGVALLELFGDVTVDDVTFSPDTFYDRLEFEVEQAFVEKGVDTEDRKDVIGHLIDALMDRMQAADPQTLGALAQTTLALLENNDILAYSVNPDVQRIFVREGWSGDLRVNAEHDHVMIVDANLAALKTDTEITRAYTYAIHKNVEGDLVATAQINYDHQGGFDYRTTRYRTYTRVYAPLGSELIRVEGSLLNDRTKNPGGAAGPVSIEEAFGATVFGAFTSVEPGANGQLSFTYKLPDRIKALVEQGTYVLDVQRQPGVGEVALNLDLDFDTPIVGAQPEEVSEFWFDDRYTYTTQARPFQRFVMEF